MRIGPESAGNAGADVGYKHKHMGSGWRRVQAWPQTKGCAERHIACDAMRVVSSASQCIAKLTRQG